MTRITLSDIKALTDAITSRDNESYQLLEKTTAYRIGVGARAESPDAHSLFLEVLITFSTKKSDVDLEQLEKTVHLLKTLYARGYMLSYLDGTNTISCERLLPYQKLSKEYTTVKSLVKTSLG
jgi:hypothetical protein